MGEAENALETSGEVKHVKSVNVNYKPRVASRERYVPRRSHPREEILGIKIESTVGQRDARKWGRWRDNIFTFSVDR